MPRRLFTVEDSFSVKGRGLVLIPGIVPLEGVRVGDPLLLKRPDGTSVSATIGGLGFLPEPPFPILLEGCSREDVPVGTEVWSAAEAVLDG
jgi:hypothetical protein